MTYANQQANQQPANQQQMPQMSPMLLNQLMGAYYQGGVMPQMMPQWQQGMGQHPLMQMIMGQSPGFGFTGPESHYKTGQAAPGLYGRTPQGQQTQMPTTQQTNPNPARQANANMGNVYRNRFGGNY